MNATPAATTTVKAKTTTPTTTTAKPAKTGPAKGSTPAYRTVNAGAFTIIRLRGTQNLNPKTKDTLKYLRLNRVNHAVVLPRNATTVGMLQVAKDYVTWGEVDAKTLAEVIRAHGRLVGDKALTDAHVAKTTPHKTIDAMASAIVAGSFHYKDIPDVKPIFRLHPARQGLEGIKRTFQVGGALGYRGNDINRLLGKMIEAKTAIGASGQAARDASHAQARTGGTSSHPTGPTKAGA